MEQLADLLEAELDPLLSRWIGLVGAQLAPGQQTVAELTDHMPSFLRRVIAALRGPTGMAEHSPIDGQSAVGQLHGAQRFRQGFELEAVVREYGLLTHLILDLIESAEASVSSRDVRQMIDQTTNAVAEATSEYARRQKVAAEAANRAENEKLSALFEEVTRLKAQLETTVLSMGDGVLATDAAGRITLLNHAGEQLTGWSATEAIGQHVRDVLRLVDASTHKELPTHFDSVLRGERAPRPSIRTLLLRRNGQTVPFADSLSAIRGHDDNVLGAVLVFRDDSPRREAERSANNFRLLIETVPQQVWTALPDGQLDLVNQRAMDYFARPQSEITTSGWHGLMHPDDLPRSVERWQQCVQSGEDYEMEFRLLRHDGEYRWHLSRARAGRGEGGEIVKWFGTATDIDETKKTHDELQRRTEFEQHLVGIVSHDLRNPLGVILTGATLLMRMEEQTERATKIATRIHSAAERSARMITDLLDFTQARLGGGIRLERSNCDIYQLASTALDEVEVAYSDRTIELTRAGDAQGHWDADRLSQVVINLLTNALKYSPAGTPVSIHIEGEADDVELSVKNEGPPIPRLCWRASSSRCSARPTRSTARRAAWGSGSTSSMRSSAPIAAASR